MNTKTLAAALLLFGSAVVASTQASPVAASDGDILLGFEFTDGSGTKNLLIDLGSYTGLGSFTNINIAGDLTTAFGSLWTNTSISYGAYGTTIAGGHWGQNYLTTTLNQTVGTLNNGNTSSKIDSIALTDFYNLQLTNGVTTTYGIWGSSSATGAWSTFLPSTAPFGVATDPSIETTLGTSLNLWNRSYATNNAGSLTPYAILVDAAGNLSVSAVPEPSTYALLGLGILVALLAVRRRASVNE